MNPITAESFKKPVEPAVYFGAATGATGAAFGACYATVKLQPFYLWTAVSGVQCFVLGSTFWYGRGVALNSLTPQNRTRRSELLCSTAGGTLAGLAGGSLRGRANILPAMFCMGVLGTAGQACYHFGFDRIASRGPKRPLLDRLADTSWWPLKKLSDDEYEEIIQKKIDRVDVELAILDDKILGLQAVKAQRSNTESGTV